MPYFVLKRAPEKHPLAEEREQIRSLISARVGEELYAGASRALRSAASVEVFEENL